MAGFRRICMVGFDATVGSFAIGLKRTGYRGTLVGVGDSATIEQCWKLGLISDGSNDLAKAIVGADLIMISPHCGHASEQLTEALRLADDGATISEMTRVKGDVNRVFSESSRTDVHYVGFRMLVDGTADPDVSHSSKFYFEGKTVILTPRGKEDLTAFSTLQNEMRKMGAKVVAMSPQAHDLVLAKLGQVPQAAVIAVLQGIFDESQSTTPSRELLAGWLYDAARDLDHLRQSGWIEDIEANRELVIEGLTALTARIAELKSDIAAGKLAAQFDSLVQCVGGKLEIEQHPERIEIALTAGNDTKVIERASEILAKARIRINHLDRIEHADAGTYRLTLNTLDDRDHAATLLRKAGVDVTVLD
jgi:cyclohexadieny/prephenate dehydrogenase / 3-phosphoshikimate 1-carboxyvinyltransferase